MTKGVKFTIYIISYGYINGYKNRMDLSSFQNIPKQLKMVENKNVNFENENDQHKQMDVHLLIYTGKRNKVKTRTMLNTMMSTVFD